MQFVKNLNIISADRNNSSDIRSNLYICPTDENVMISITPKNKGSNQYLIKIYNYVNDTIIKQHDNIILNEIPNKIIIKFNYLCLLSADNLQTYYKPYNNIIIMNSSTFDIIEIFLNVCFQISNIWIIGYSPIVAIISEYGISKLECNTLYFNTNHVGRQHLLCNDITLCAPTNCIQLQYLQTPIQYAFYNYKSNKFTTHEYCAIKKINNNKYVCIKNIGTNPINETYIICEYLLLNDCCVCYEQIEVKKVIVPCGHTNLCQKCYDKTTNDRTCPTCRTPIDNFIKLYI